MQDKIGIIGFGNMGSAIAGQLDAHYQVVVFDRDRDKTRGVRGAVVAADLAALLKSSVVVVLAVKPQDVDGVLKLMRGHAGEQLIISICAGISTGHIEKILGRVRVVRAMPNIGVRIADSVTCLSRGSFAGDEDMETAQQLFYYLGTTRVIDERMMNAATAISGSGPAYVFHFLEENSIGPLNVPEHARHDIIKRLAQAAEGLGFGHEDAVFLAANSVNMSLELLQKTNAAPAELRAQVTSKGGTTEAGLAALRKSGSWEDAARAALKRAEELARRD